MSLKRFRKRNIEINMTEGNETYNLFHIFFPQFNTLDTFKFLKPLQKII